MSTSEIAKLESRWRENPQGLTFAPLAEAYRKMKEPQRALEILGEGIGLHPDYIPASIVLGGGLGGYAARQGMGVLIPTAFLKFSRQDESEADYLGTQYLYAAGYDPSGAISIFEKIEALSRTKPGFAARIFSTHPMDSDRIRKTQQEIEQILPAKSEYLVNTSEYQDMRERLIEQDARRKSDTQDPRRPSLRVAPGTANPEDGHDERPTIKRRELVQ